MERLITEEQFEQVRLHMRDTYDVAEHEWDEEELIEAIYELIAKNNEVLDLVSSSLRIEDFHIGFEYLQYEMDSERYLNKGMIWKKKKYGFNSPRLHKIKELIDNGEIARCNES